jgi:hypothetical protein
MSFQPFMPPSFGCIDPDGNIVAPTGAWVTYRCNEGHVTRILDTAEYECELCMDMVPTAPPDAYPCKHCSAELEGHAETSCLFMPTKFEPMDREQLQRESDAGWAP